MRSAQLLAGALAALLLLHPSVRADEGHSHGEAPPAPNAHGPRRQPDGSVNLPKPAQRQIGVRTQVAEPGRFARSVELNGRVLMDPNAGGKVQALVAGRIEAGPRGLPWPGMAVRKGEVLAHVAASASPLERASQAAQLAELRAARALADRRLVRLKELSDTVPRKEIEAAESEAASLSQRAAAIGAGIAHRDALLAPVSGVIASANVVAGQVVDARELLFEIVDPARLRIEALAFDPALGAEVVDAAIAIGERRVPLRYVGAARSLRDQALPLNFSAGDEALALLAVGQPVRVFVRTRQAVDGIAVPAAALMRNPANQAIVWVKTAPERFEPRTVAVEPLDGVNVAVTAGLKPGERIVLRGASLVNQIR